MYGSSKTRADHRRAGLNFHKGFTMIELVMVIVMLGILAVVAVPKIINSGDINARGFHDETLSYLRFAQKTAIAQRRTVCVAFSSSTVTLTIASAAGATSCASALSGPTGQSPAVLTAKTGVTFGSTPTAFNFDGLGQPVNASGVAVAKQTLQVANTDNTIYVESATGYIHE